jgi:hypothetical protein
MATYKGLYYENLSPKYQGIYDNVDFDTEPTPFKFKDFKPEKIDQLADLTDAERKTIVAEANKNGVSAEQAVDPAKNSKAFKKKP